MVRNLTYTQYDDYYIPDIRLAHTGTQTLGKYGRMRRAFLEKNKLILQHSKSHIVAMVS